MLNQPIHILNQMGIMTSFSVAKRVSENYINNYFSRHKKTGKSEKQIEQMLREKILSDIDSAILHNQITGLISPQEIAREMGLDKELVKNIPELNTIIMGVKGLIESGHYDKNSLCYVINNLVTILNLTEEDFDKFHSQNNPDGDDGEEPAAF